MDANLEATCDALYWIACEVNEALYHQYHKSMEEQYQSALSYELKKKKYVFHSETVIQLLYKDFPVKESEVDYFLLPGGPNKFDKNIVIEVKHPTTNALPAPRLQLFSYLHTGPSNNNPFMDDLRYGILLMWQTQSNPTVSDDGKYAELKLPAPKPIMELWKTTNKTTRHKFELLKKWE
ncbi:MAG: hypothetical protein CMA97_05870 [Euryarchaeota archaeon]|nr:hypothetical protein [Euryarchaeota archaeon]